MADIYPFKGYRYNEEQVGDINKVVTPPYDKIEGEDRIKFQERNPYNIIRLILGEDEHKKEEYQQAADYLQDWIDKDVLIQESEAGFYAYNQEYEVAGQTRVRKGFVGLGKIEDEKGVKAHENTMAGPKADRLNLIRATEANFGHIFMLYSDRQKKIIKLLDDEVRGKEPLLKVNDENGNLHKLWPIKDQEIIDFIKEQMADRDLYIADGHHRYQTALNFKKECEKKGYRGDFDKRLMTFVNFDDPGLTILATHRLVYGLDDFDPDRFLNEITRDFAVKKYEDRSRMYEDLEENRGRKNCFGLCFKDREGFWVLTLKNKNVVQEMNGDHSRDWCELDVAVLHKAILEQRLGIDKKALESKKNIEYVRGRDSAIDKLQQGNYQACFILNPTPERKVMQIADRGEKMPQKSTDFYPKLLTGLVIHKLNIQK